MEKCKQQIGNHYSISYTNDIYLCKNNAYEMPVNAYYFIKFDGKNYPTIISDYFSTIAQAIKNLKNTTKE